MGTRSKSKAAAGLLSALLLLALAVGLLAGLRPLYARAQEQGVLFYYYDPFVENIQTANHTLYWRAREQWEGKELLLSDANAAVYAAREAGEDFVLGYTGAAGDESGGTNASYGGLDVYAPDAISALDAFNASVKAHADELAGSWGNLFYAVTDDATGKTYTNTEAGLGGFLSDDPAKNGFDAAQWRYVLALRFDAQGNMSYAASYLGEEGQQDFSASIWNTDMQAYGTDAIRRHLDLDVLSYYDLSAPKSVTFVYGVPRVFAASDDISWYIATSQERSFISHAFDPLFAAALALAALLALWFGRRRGSGLGGGGRFRVGSLSRGVGCGGSFGAVGVVRVSRGFRGGGVCVGGRCQRDLFHRPYLGHFQLQAILLPGKPDLFRGGVADLDGRLLRQDGHLHGHSHFFGYFFGQGLPGGLSGIRRGFLSGSGGGVGLRCGSSVRGGDLRLVFQRGGRRGETKQGTQCQRERKHSALHSLVPLS